MIGRHIGPIRILSRLGAGGMGTVYLGATGGSRVAVKVLHPHLLEREGAFKRFQREANVGRLIDHPRVVHTLDCDLAVVDGEPRCYLVTEYVEGRTLARLLEELGRVPEALLREIALQVADGLDAIHEAGAIHRDLKPQNVLITRDDEVKIMDLGLAWLPDGGRLSETGQFLGTLLYAAPEQIRPEGHTLDGRADLYALGMVLHELAAGAHPFDGERPAEVLDRVLRGPIPVLAELAEGISPFFDAVVTRLHARRPEDRFRDAAGLREILREGERSPWWRRRTAPVQARPVRRLRLRRETALFGREAELGRLRAAFDDARRGRGRVVVLEGEAGVGKTRLVDELVASALEDGREPAFLAGGFPPGGAATVLGAHVDALREHLGLDGLEDRLRRLLDGTPLLVPGLAALLRGEPPPPGAEPMSLDTILGAFARTVAALAAQRPVIWFVDDLQFAPEEGLSALAALLPSLRDHAILVVAATHPGLPARWLGDVLRLDQVERLVLRRLPASTVERMLGEALDSDVLAARLGGLVARESEGNPYFVFEILRGLRESGALVRAPDGSWRADERIDRIELPDSLRGLVRARLMDLDPEDRHALEVAACCGVEFDPVPVASALGLGRIPTLRRLASIERNRRLIQASGRRFAFDHHLVREELYSSMPPPLREAMHAALVDALATDGDPDGPTAVEIVHHGVLGRCEDAARRHLPAALDHLDRSFSLRRAAELAGRLLAREGFLAGRERVDLLLRRARYLLVLGRNEETERLLEEARAEVDVLGEPDLESRVTCSQADLAAGHGRYAEAAEGLRRAAAVAREACLVPEEIRALMSLAGCHADLREFDAAREAYERCLALARETGLPSDEGRAIGNLGFLALEQGRVEEARERFEEASRIFDRVGERRGQATARGALGLVLGKLGRYEEALAHHEAHLRVAREIGDRRGESAAIGNVGVCQLNLGRLEEAIRHLRRDRSIARELGNARGSATAAVNLAQAYLECGDLVEAGEMAGRAVEEARELELAAAESTAHRILGEIDAEHGRIEPARDHLARSLARAEEAGLESGAAETLLARGRLELGHDPDSARTTLAASLERAAGSGADGVSLVASALMAGLDESTRSAAEGRFEALAPSARMHDRIEAGDALGRATGEARYRDLARAGRNEVLAGLSQTRRRCAERLALFRRLADDGGGERTGSIHEGGVT